jgi:integrase
MSIHKIVNPASGTVTYRVDVKPSRTASRIRKTFTRIADAKAFEVKYRSEYQQKTFLGKDNTPDMPVSALIDGYYSKYVVLHIKNPERAERSRLEMFKNYFKDRSVHSLSHTDGETFMAERLQAGIKPGTINRDLNVLRSLFKWAARNHYLESSPFKEIQKIKTDEVRVRWLTTEEVYKLLDRSDYTLANIIKVALNTGFRKSNIINLEKSDVGDTFITARKTKSGKPYQVPISAALHQILARLPSIEGSNQLLDTNGLRERFEDVCKKAGLWTSKNDPNKVTFHTLRHTFAAHALLSGVDIYTVSHWLGHASIAITQKHYGHLAESHHTEQIKKFSGLS